MDLVVNLDIQDVLANAIGSVIGRFLMFLMAAWLGCVLGFLSLAAGLMAEDGPWNVSIPPLWIWASPLLLLNSWALLNFPILLFLLARFIREDGDDCVTLGIVVAMESLAVMLGWAHELTSGGALAISWCAWLTFAFMCGSALWLMRCWLMNSQLYRLARLRERIARKRIQFEKQERAD
jgi:hypothetical protein